MWDRNSRNKNKFFFVVLSMLLRCNLIYIFVSAVPIVFIFFFWLLVIFNDPLLHACLNAFENNNVVVFYKPERKWEKKKSCPRCALLYYINVTLFFRSCKVIFLYKYKDYRTGMWKKKLYEMSRVGEKKKGESPNV